LNNELGKKPIKISSTNLMFNDEIRKKKQRKKKSPYSLSTNNEGCESYPHLFLVYSIIFQDFLNVYI